MKKSGIILTTVGTIAVVSAIGAVSVVAITNKKRSNRIHDQMDKLKKTTWWWNQKNSRWIT
ncbi:hypothetical protein [Metamycoplasma alkalescens]|uniref:hypothetical protein n=1 Tax=Metamycoplasma alkalescens TaxID=45363 RepID=UPI003D01C3E9